MLVARSQYGAAAALTLSALLVPLHEKTQLHFQHKKILLKAHVTGPKAGFTPLPTSLEMRSPAVKAPNRTRNGCNLSHAVETRERRGDGGLSLTKRCEEGKQGSKERLRSHL